MFYFFLGDIFLENYIFEEEVFVNRVVNVFKNKIYYLDF